MAQRGNNRGGVQVRVHRSNRNDGYLITPNELFRGEDVYADLPPLARLMLGAGLSCKDEWDTTLEDIEGWLMDPDKRRPIGRDRQEAIRRVLREQGFMTMTPDRVPAGEPDGGRFRWVIAFYMDPLPADQRDKLNEKKPRGKSSVTVPGFSGHGDDEEETPGQTVPGFSGPGESGHGTPGPENQGALYKEEKNQGEKNPPLPPKPGSPAVVAGAVQGGRFDDETKDMLAAALAEVQSLKPRWKPDDVRAAMIAEIDDGRTSSAVARAVVELAKDPATQGPGRLKHAGPWWNEPAGGADGPVRYIDREAARCGEHRGEPADGCGKCKAEQYAPEYDQTREQLDAPTDAAAARALIRQATAAGAAKYKTQTRRGTSPTVAATRACSSALDALTAAAAELEGTTDDEMFAPVVEPESVRELAQVAAS